MHQIQGPAAHDPDTFDVRGALLGVYRTAILEWRVIAVSTTVVLVVAIAYAIWWPPVYQAQASLMSEGDRDQARDSFYGGWSIFRKDDMRTESELFTSSPVLKEVIRREKLTYDDIYHPIGSHLAYLWSTSFVGRAYRGFKDWLFKPEGERMSPEEEDRQRTLADMKAGINLTNIGEANMGQLTVRAPTPRASDIANTLIAVYLEQRLERYRAESMKSVETLSEEALTAEKALDAIEREKVAFMRDNGLGLGIEKEKFEVQKLADLEERMGDTRSKIAGTEASLRELERQIKSEPATRTTTTSYEMNAVRETTKMKRLELQTALVMARSRYREESPEVQDLLTNIAGLDAIISGTSERVPRATTESVNSSREELRNRENNLASELAGLKASLAAMERRARELRSRMIGLPALELRLAHYEREYKFAQDKYLNLMGKRAQASISLAGLRAMPSMRVISEAVRPDKKYWPKNLVLYPLALVFGMVVGLAIALAKSVIQGRIRREHLLQGRGSAAFYGLVDVPARATRIEVVIPERLTPPAST